MADDGSPLCKVCGKRVAVWRTESPEEAVCMDCCEHVIHADGETGHQYYYERWEGWTCKYCAASPTNDFWDYLNSLGD